MNRTRGRRPRAAVAALLLAAPGFAQGGGLRCDGPVVAGGSMTILVATNDASVEVGVAGSAATTSHQVGPGRQATVPVPVVPAGTLLLVSIGRGLRARVILVEVLPP